MFTPQLNELDRKPPTDAHLLAISKCVVEWARLESQLRALLTAIEGRSLNEGARDYSRLTPDEAWKAIKREVNKIPNSEDAVENIQANREAGREYYSTRKHIVHSGLVGCWTKDQSYMAFAPFEAHGGDQMTFLWIPIDEMERSAQFARSAGEMALKLMVALGH